MPIVAASWAAGPAKPATATAPIGTAATTRPWAKLPRSKSPLMKSNHDRIRTPGRAISTEFAETNKSPP